MVSDTLTCVNQLFHQLFRCLVSHDLAMWGGQMWSSCIGRRGYMWSEVRLDVLPNSQTSVWNLCVIVMLFNQHLNMPPARWMDLASEQNLRGTNLLHSSLRSFNSTCEKLEQRCLYFVECTLKCFFCCLNNSQNHLNFLFCLVDALSYCQSDFLRYRLSSPHGRPQISGCNIDTSGFRA